MSSETSAFAVPESVALAIKKDPVLLRLLFGLEKTDDPAWKLAPVAFGGDLYKLVRMLYGAGANECAALLDVECRMSPRFKKAGLFFDYEGYEVWVLKAPEAAAAYDFLSCISYEKGEGVSNTAYLKKKAAENGATDYEGEPIPEQAYDDYLRGYEKAEAFFRTCWEQKLWAVLCNA